jgi:UDP-glucose 4-epimerase
VLLITGATGYLGRALVPALEARGLPLRIAMRDGDLGSGADASARSRGVLDLARVESAPASTFEGLSTALHCAGLAHRSAPVEDYLKLNTEATLRIAQRAHIGGAGAFIFISSLNIVPVGADSASLAAEAYPEPPDPYAASKWRAEQELHHYCAGVNMALRIVRPALIYDGELTANLAHLQRLVRRWPLALPALGSRSMIARPDLVALLGSIAEETDQFSCVIPATDGEHYDVRRIGRALGGCGRPTLPRALLRLASIVLDARSGGRWGDAWQTLATAHWVGAPHREYVWRPRWTLESLLASDAAL